MKQTGLLHFILQQPLFFGFRLFLDLDYILAYFIDVSRAHRENDIAG